MLRKLVKSLISEKSLGFIDYYRFPNQRSSWGGPFNGQAFRKEIFNELIKTISLSCIVETGTYKATTTKYMSQTSQLPIYTTELSARNFGFASWVLRRHKNVIQYQNDSRVFLKELASKPILTDNTTLFYLDAHWHADLPLAEELEIIFNNWKQSVILIDDFQVPDDPGYAYDDYGIGKALTLDYLKVHESVGYNVFFPALNSEKETGAKRGLAVLSNNPALIFQLSSFETLRAYP